MSIIITTEIFIERAKAKHGDKYGYDKVDYIGGKIHVKIFCKECNAYFLQKPSLHYRHGCLKCSERENGLKRRTPLNKFIKLARLKHGEKYGYEKVSYSNSREKVKIYCRKCEEYFLQTVSDHINQGHGCHACSGVKRVTKSDFIKRSVQTHGNKYGYDSVIFINTATKVNIYCNKCEDYFYQLPSGHIKGKGCLKCGGRMQMTHDDFVKKGRERHGNKYDYISQYINAKTKISIKCNDCSNINNISPNTHLGRGKGGCPFCGGGAQSNKDDFIKKANKIHGKEHYNYDEFVYVKAIIKGKIFCNAHKKIFLCAPYNHLSGKGCPTCGQEISNNASKKSLKDFMKDVARVHGNTYTYDESSYAGCKDKLNIYCEDHGLFTQTPSDHIHGKQGCPRCKSSHGEREVRKILESLNSIFDEQYHIKKCKTKRTLPFDFAILTQKKELKGLIEFHGRQHYSEIKFFGGKEGYEKRNRNDQLKSDFCSFNKIPFLVVDDDSDLEVKIGKFVSSLKNKRSIIGFRKPDQINIFKI